MTKEQTLRKAAYRQIELQRAEQIAESFINGNISWVVDEVRKMNKLQLVDLLSNAKHYGVKTHNLIATLQIHLED